MEWVFVLFVGVVLTLAIPIRGQIDCSKPPAAIPKNVVSEECCVPVKWTETVLEKKCKAEPNDVCRSECLFHDAKLIDENGAINSANVKATFEAELNHEPHYIPIAVKAFDMCYPLALKDANNRKIGSCALAPALTLDCVIRTMFANCLPSKWKSNPNCDAAKTFMDKCPIRHVP